MAGLETRRAKILIIDNNPAEIRLIASVLPLSTVKLIATSASKAMEIMLSSPELPSLVLLDVTLAGPAEGAFCQKLLTEPPMAIIPRILIGNRPSELDPLMNLNCGFDCILRPFSPDDLALMIKVQLQIQDMQRELREIERDRERIINARAQEIVAFQASVRSVVNRLLGLCPPTEGRPKRVRIQ
jgi:putative two-component system response regulator